MTLVHLRKHNPSPQSVIAQAVADFQNGLSLRKVCEKYDTARSSFQNHLKGSTGTKSKKNLVYLNLCQYLKLSRQNNKTKTKTKQKKPNKKHTTNKFKTIYKVVLGFLFVFVVFIVVVVVI